MTEHGYGPYSRGCRCEICRSAKSAYLRRRRAEASEQRRAAEADGVGRYVAGATVHGLSGYQNHACRCRVCRAAKSAAGLRETRRSS